MTPAAIIKEATADGVNLTLSGTGTIKASGDQAAINRWVPILREHKPGILAVLIESGAELFTFTPPGDQANDDEALQERVAIMMEGNGWDEAAALREARWGADRERCWHGFLRNAQRILDAPRAEREGLLGRYRREATERYGEAAGANMVLSLAAWIAGHLQ